MPTLSGADFSLVTIKNHLISNKFISYPNPYDLDPPCFHEKLQVQKKVIGRSKGIFQGGWVHKRVKFVSCLFGRWQETVWQETPG